MEPDTAPFNEVVWVRLKGWESSEVKAIRSNRGESKDEWLLVRKTKSAVPPRWPVVSWRPMEKEEYIPNKDIKPPYRDPSEAPIDVEILVRCVGWPSVELKAIRAENRCFYIQVNGYGYKPVFPIMDWRPIE